MTQLVVRIGISIALCVFMLPSIALAQSVPPSADTFSNSAAPNANYGSQPAVVVQHGANSYLKFNLTSMPSGVTVKKATLRLFVDAVAAAGKFDLYQVNSSWNENTLTYNNAPPLGASVTGGNPLSISASSLNQFVLVDITSLVQNWASGNVANNGLALALTTTGGAFSFDSKESTYTSHQPELEVVLNSPTGPTGPQGPPGPQGPQGMTGSQGPVGQAGPQGPMGLTGPQGTPGANGTNGTNGTGFNFTGSFAPATNYNPYDVVTYNGSTYDATVAISAGITPGTPNSGWALMAQAGAAGPEGPQGAAGSPGTTGPVGPQGPQGPPGTAPSNVAVTSSANTFAASQTINGSLVIAGSGNGIQFADGTVQSTAASGSSSGVPSGFAIFGSSPVPPTGFTLLGSTFYGNAWSALGSGLAAMPTPRLCLAAVTVNGVIYAIGGISAQSGAMLNTLEAYDPVSNTWSTKASMPTARADLAAVVVNGLIYAIGGGNFSANPNTLNAMEVYDPASDTWTTKSSMPTARFSLGAVVMNGLIYAIGGEATCTLAVGSLTTAVVEIYDPSSDTWSTGVPLVGGITRTVCLTQPYSTGLAGLAATVVNGNIYAIGGVSDTVTLPVGTVEVFDPTAGAWSTTAATRPGTQAVGLSAALLNGKIYTVDSGGGTQIYDPASNSWTQGAGSPIVGNSYAQGVATAVANGLFYALGQQAVSLYSPPTVLYTFVKN